MFDPLGEARERLDKDQRKGLTPEEARQIGLHLAAFRRAVAEGRIELERDPERPKGSAWTSAPSQKGPKGPPASAAEAGRRARRASPPGRENDEIPEAPPDLRSLDMQLVPWAEYRASYGLEGPPVAQPSVYADHVELEELTAPFRSARRNALMYDAYRAAVGEKVRILPGGEVKACTPRWYRSRAEGQARRFVAAVSCGDNEISYACPTEGCACAGVSPDRCAIARLCVACRAHQAKRRQARFGEARISVLDEFERKWPRLMHARNADRFSEKFLTLTLPPSPIDAFMLYPETVRRKVATRLGIPLDELDLRLKKPYGEELMIVALRVEILFRAWRFFTVQLYRYLEAERARIVGLTPTAWRKRRRRMARVVRKGPVIGPEQNPNTPWPPEPKTFAELPPFFLHRSFEATVGNDGIGHPHFHVWMFGPRLPGKPDSGEMAVFVEQLAAWELEPEDMRGPRPEVPRILLREWWRKALQKAGMRVGDDDDLVFDLRELKPRKGSDIRGELIKAGGKNLKYGLASRLEMRPSSKGEDVVKYADGWCLVDRDQTGAAPRVMLARFYEALEGRRLTQASRGFLARAVSAAASGCREHGVPLVVGRHVGGVSDALRSAIAARQKPN